MKIDKNEVLYFWQHSWWISFLIFALVSASLFLLIYNLLGFSFQLYPLYAFIIAFLANIAVILLQNYRRWHFFGLILSKFSLKHFIFGFSLPLLLFIPLLFLLALKGIHFSGLTITDLALLLYQIGFLATAEELFFRGVIFQRLIDKLGEASAVFITSIVFAIFHLLNPHLTFISLFNIFLAGVMLGVCYIKTYSLWLPIGVHIGWNFWQQFLLDSPISGHSMFISLFKTNITSFNKLLFGGSFGLEGGLVSSFLLLLIIYIVSKSFVPIPEVISKILRERYS